MTDVKREAEEWVEKHSEWEANIWGEKLGMTMEEQARRPSSIPANLAIAYEAGHASASAKYAKVVEALEKIAKNRFEMGGGVVATGSHHTLMQIAREALASLEPILTKPKETK